MKHVYYFSPLEFHFRSGSTLQESRNFRHLAALGYKTQFYGTSSDGAELQQVREYIADAEVALHVWKGSRRWNRLVDLVMLKDMAQDRNPDKIVIARHVKRTDVLVRLRGWLGNPVIVHELHERALPHLLTENGRERRALKALTRRVFDNVDGLFLSNYSQEILLKQEFDSLPRFVVLPHAVEAEKFSDAASNLTECTTESEMSYVVTFMGHFPAWRDIEKLFQSLAKLDGRFTLRIAGGISGETPDEVSRRFIQDLTDRYGLEGRVDYRGHVPPGRLVTDVLNGSSVLVLPLGDNLSARYFTCPIKLLEYMATQIPVVAVDYPSVSLLTGKESVFLSDDNPEAFAQTILCAVSSPELPARIRRMNEIARRSTFQERSRRLDEWYTQLLMRHKQGHLCVELSGGSRRHR